MPKEGSREAEIAESAADLDRKEIKPTPCWSIRIRDMGPYISNLDLRSNTEQPSWSPITTTAGGGAGFSLGGSSTRGGGGGGIGRRRFG